MPYHGANIQTKFVITKQNFKKIMIMDKINNEVSLPYVNKAIKKLIDEYFKGNVSKFSKEIGIKHQSINQLYHLHGVNLLTRFML